MGTIDIRFEGICTQIKLPQAVGSTLHRVVMVHAEEGCDLEGKQIPPHRTFLCIDDTTLVDANVGGVSSLMQQTDGSWQLYGARLTVNNAAGNSVTYDASTYDVPSLTTLTPDFGALSPEVVFGTNAASHFDISSGTFTAAQMAGGAFYTTVTVTTSSEPVVVGVQDLIGGNSGTLTFLSGSTIVVKNTGNKIEGDTAFDFLLHYLTASRFPPDAKVPPPTEPLPGASHINFSDEVLGPGCSNSTFP